VPEIKQTYSSKQQSKDALPFGSLKAFELIGRLGGIRKAALALGIDHAGVSRHLKTLERWAGTTLLDRRRGENGCLTPKGLRYHARISAALCEIDNAGADLTQASGMGCLHVWCAPGLAYKWLLRHLDKFTDTYSDLQVDLRVTDSGPDIARADTAAHIGFVGDWLARGVPAGIQTAELSRPCIIPVVSPSFLAGAGTLSCSMDIVDLPLLHEEDESQWSNWLARQEIPAPGTLGGRRLWHANLTIDAAKRGQGVALAADLLVADDIRQGDLVELHSGGQSYPRVHIGGFALAAREDRWRTPPIERFRDWLRVTMQRDIDVSS
jgi:DNA-binding transcriptional LysR family regulator